VSVPATSPGRGAGYEKFAHPASRYAIVGVAAIVRIEGGACVEARVAVTGAGAQAVRLPALEAALADKALDDATLGAACRGLLASGDLLGDQFASADYRAHLVDVLARRALAKAASRA
jgi:carbon-monoxide dehydrogenase medium subunit